MLQVHKGLSDHVKETESVRSPSLTLFNALRVICSDVLKLDDGVPVLAEKRKDMRQQSQTEEASNPVDSDSVLREGSLGTAGNHGLESGASQNGIKPSSR